jgi:hypothetical protein
MQQSKRQRPTAGVRKQTSRLRGERRQSSILVIVDPQRVAEYLERAGSGELAWPSASLSDRSKQTAIRAEYTYRLVGVFERVHAAFTIGDNASDPREEPNIRGSRFHPSKHASRQRRLAEVKANLRRGSCSHETRAEHMDQSCTKRPLAVGSHRARS